MKDSFQMRGKADEMGLNVAKRVEEILEYTPYVAAAMQKLTPKMRTQLIARVQIVATVPIMQALQFGDVDAES